MLQQVPIAPAQVKGGRTSEKKQIVYYLYLAK